MRYVSHWPLGVPLLYLAVYLPTGTLRRLGFTALFAYTRRKVPGMRSVTYTAVRSTAEVCSSLSRRGGRWVALHRRSMGSRRRALVSSYTAPGLSGDVTVTGTSGELRERAV